MSRLPDSPQKSSLHTVVTTAIATILLVEDDSLLRHAFRLLLEDAGYRIHEAGTAHEAVEKAREDTPDLVLLDMGYPMRLAWMSCARCACTSRPRTRRSSP